VDEPLTAPLEESLPDPARAAFWMLACLVALVAVSKCVLADTMDPDAFWHVRVASQLLHDGIGPLVDNLSYASDKTPWTPYSWLAELIMKWTWDRGGYQATILLTAACAAAFVLGLASSCLDRTKPGPRHLSSMVAIVLGGYFTLPFISFRPVTFALALMSIMLAILQRDRLQKSRWVWLIVPLTLLTTNLHLYGAVMALIVALSAIGSFWDDRPRFRRQFLLATATIAAACCTPMLRGAIETSLRYSATDPMVASNFITEMRPFYAGTMGKVSLAIVIGIVLLAVAKRRALGVTDWLFLLFGVAALFRLGRFAPVFALLAMPVLAHTLPALRDRALTRPAIRYAMLLVLVMGTSNLVLTFPYHTKFDVWLNRNNAVYPTAAAAYIDGPMQPGPHRLINEFNWGGYLAWRFGGRYQVLMDGRTQMYSPDFWRKTHLGTYEDRVAFLKTVDAEIAILPAHDSAFRAPLESLGWRKTFEDDLAVILVPPER
jgi:hypothetical protein